MTADKLARIIHQGLKMIVALLEKELKTTKEGEYLPANTYYLPGSEHHK